MIYCTLGYTVEVLTGNRWEMCGGISPDNKNFVTQLILQGLRYKAVSVW